jgi:hypothetical protein
VERCCQMKGGIGGEVLPDERRYWWSDISCKASKKMVYKQSIYRLVYWGHSF